MVDYGSGALGDWSGLGHAVSTNWAPAQPKPRVAIVGDSIVTRGRTKLAGLLLAEFGIDLAYDYWSGRPTKPAVDALLARDVWPDILIMACGTNDIFDPTVMAAQIQRVLDAAPSTTTVVWVDVQAVRAGGTTARQLADQRLSMAVNRQIYGSDVEHIVEWSWWLAGNELGWRMANYLEDGVHPWTAAGTTPYKHGDGTAFWADILMRVVRPLLQAAP